MKNTWCTIKNIIGNSKSEILTPEYIDTGNEQAHEKKEMVNIFNDYFVSIGSKLAKEFERSQNESFKNYLLNPVEKRFSFSNINEHDVVKIINTLKPKSSCG